MYLTALYCTVIFYFYVLYSSVLSFAFYCFFNGSHL